MRFVGVGVLLHFDSLVVFRPVTQSPRNSNRFHDHEQADCGQHNAAAGGNIGIKSNDHTRHRNEYPDDRRGDNGPGQALGNPQADQHRNYDQGTDEQQADHAHRNRNRRPGQNCQPQVQQVHPDPVDLCKVGVERNLGQLRTEQHHKQGDHHCQNRHPPEVGRRNRQDAPEQIRKQRAVKTLGNADQNNRHRQCPVQENRQCGISGQEPAHSQFFDGHRSCCRRHQGDRGCECLCQEGDCHPRQGNMRQRVGHQRQPAQYKKHPERRSRRTHQHRCDDRPVHKFILKYLWHRANGVCARDHASTRLPGIRTDPKAPARRVGAPVREKLCPC